eukprot:CAMPEP_0118891444 /NCGR_PEP_ID=MMETSP1166-20130328/1456_1 /TAXON_ID=1104430 /ORGANISM="Chrysoreinhardia sp, Strain CCMP3193" /LENGTH=338 /DNA_ID=CAMNT_0006830103 /DNA_START=101 /DNA_END=1117 /DNA_ORIENTATION=+
MRGCWVVFFFSSALTLATARDISVDVAYLHAIASVHEFCEGDFDTLCNPHATTGGGSRRLSEMVITITALIETDDQQVNHKKSSIPLGLGSDDWGLRDNFKDLSTGGQSAIALVDATGAPPRDPKRCEAFFFALAFVAGFAMIFVGLKKLKKLRKVKQILKTIRQDPDLRAKVEDASGVSLDFGPKGPTRCCQTLVTVLAALFAGYALTLVLGPVLALAFVWAVLIPAAIVNNCFKRRTNDDGHDVAVNPAYEPPAYEPQLGLLSKKHSYVCNLPVIREEEANTTTITTDANAENKAEVVQRPAVVVVVVDDDVDEEDDNKDNAKENEPESVPVELLV